MTKIAPSTPPVAGAAQPARATDAAPAAPDAVVPPGAQGAHNGDVYSNRPAARAGDTEASRPADARAGCPHRSAAEKAEQAKKIPCPALSAMFTSDMLPTAEDGTVQIADLDKALTELGLSRGVRRILTHGGDKVDETKGSFNLFELNGSSLDHTGSSGIRQNGVHPERFELLASFSKDGQRLTPSDLADAAKHFERESPGLRGAIIQLAEIAILLETFGQRDEKNRPYFAIDDARKLWLDGQLPDSWHRPAVPGSVRLDEILARAAKMKASQIF
jgi:hypothetical protein